VSTSPLPWDKYSKPQAASQPPWEKYSAPKDAGPQYQKTVSTGQGEQPKAGKALDFVANKLVGAAPGIGMVAGGMAGALAGGVGAVAGAGAGGAAGEAYKEKVQGEKLSGKKIAISGAMGAGAEAGGMAIGAGLKMLPNAARAAKLLEGVKGKAGDLPVDLSRSGDSLLRIKELSQAGHGNLPVINKLIERYTAPVKTAIKGVREDAKPLTYSEARDFYQAISKLSAKDSMAITGTMKRELGQFANALKQDIGDAADQAGQAAQYYSGMKEYHKAMKMARVADDMKSFLTSKVVRYGLEAVGLGAGAGLAVKYLGAK
jgi:hypothetical protein